MFKHAFALTALLFYALFPASGAVPPEALGTVRYEVRYKLAGKGSKVADAAISLENGTRDGNPVLHSHAAINASSIFRLFLNAEYIADAYLTQDAKEPLYSVNPIKKGKKEGKFECIYDKAAGTVRTEFAPPSTQPVKEAFPLDGRTMDLLSLIQYVRFLDLPAGSSQEMHLLIGGKSLRATLTNQGADQERFPGERTDRFFLKMFERGLMENGSGNEITVWRSNGIERRILGLETALSTGVMTVSVVD